MKEFAHAVLTLMTFVLVLAAAVMMVFWLLAIGDRRPDVAASVWFMSAVACMVAAGICAWCVAVLNHLHYLEGLHQMVEKHLHDQRAG